MAVENSINTGNNQAWYIYRYRTMTATMKEYFQKTNLEVYMPTRYFKTCNAKGQSVFINKSLVSSYIFVHSTPQQAIEFGKPIGLSLWRKRVVESQDHTTPLTVYHSIPNPEMQRFITAIESNKYDIEFFDAANIDLEKDDRVRIISGDFAGSEGYLKVTNGRDGGLVIVPLSQDERSSTGIYYTIQAKPQQIAVLQFAKSNRHYYNKMESAQKYVATAMQQYISGQAMGTALIERLYTFVARYADTKLYTDLQMAQHHLLLYRIYTILEKEVERLKELKELQDVCVPMIQRKCNEERQQHYLALMTQANDAPTLRKENIARHFHKKALQQ